MDAERWARAKELFHQALERSPDARDAFLREACAGDERLLETVAAMLAREPEAAGFLEASALRGAAGAVAAELARRDARREQTPRPYAPPHEPGPTPVSPGWRQSWWMVLLALVFLADVLAPARPGRPLHPGHRPPPWRAARLAGLLRARPGGRPRSSSALGHGPLSEP